MSTDDVSVFVGRSSSSIISTLADLLDRRLLDRSRHDPSTAGVAVYEPANVHLLQCFRRLPQAVRGNSAAGVGPAHSRAASRIPASTGRSMTDRAQLGLGMSAGIGPICSRRILRTAQTPKKHPPREDTVSVLPLERMS